MFCYWWAYDFTIPVSIDFLCIQGATPHPSLLSPSPVTNLSLSLIPSSSFTSPVANLNYTHLSFLAIGEMDPLRAQPRPPRPFPLQGYRHRLRHLNPPRRRDLENVRLMAS